jgi:hypothetical protein
VAAASSQSARFRAPDRPNLLLFGAFPRATGSHQTVIDAVHEVTTTWLSRGGAVTFGGHPTFTPLVLGVARTQAPSIDREQVTIYQSLARASGADREALNERAVAVFTEDLGDDAASLTLMRSRMVDESGAVAAVAIGGRTDEGGTHAPGTQEEVDLARGRSVPIPVFLLAATGGHTAVMAAEAAQTEPPWAALGTPLTADGNAQLAGSDDFWAIARQIWDLTVGSP